MHLKTMAQAVSGEPCDVDLHDPLKLKPAGFSTDLPSDQPDVLGVDPAGDKSTEETEQCGENSSETNRERTALVSTESRSLVVPTLMCGPAQCKSDEDDGYCSRSSLDSPVQALQSDSEAVDHEVFALRDCTIPTCSQTSSAEPAVKPNVGKLCPGYLGGLSTANQSSVSASLSEGSSSSSVPSVSHSGVQQKIVIVNKSTNVRYFIPTTGSSVVSSTTSNVSAVPVVRPPPLSQHIQLVSQAANVKALKGDANKSRSGPITLLRVQDKEATGSSFIPSETRAVPEEEYLCSEKEGVAGTTSDGDNDCATGTDSATATSLSLTGAADEDVSEIEAFGRSEPEGSHLRSCNGLLSSTIADVYVKKSGQTTSGGVVQIAKSVTRFQGSKSTVSASNSKFGLDGRLCLTNVDKASTSGESPLVSSRDAEAINCSVTVSKPATESQKILKACLSSSTTLFGESCSSNSLPSLSINSQAGLGMKNTTYQLQQRGNQDVTVILLPQTSVQSVTSKTNVIGEIPCKQVLLRIGQGQVLKAITVNAENTKLTQPKAIEKLAQTAAVEPVQNKTQDTSRSSSALIFEGLTTSSLNVRENPGVNKGVGVGERLRGNVKVAGCVGRQLVNSEKQVVSVSKSLTSIGHFASLSLPSVQGSCAKNGSVLRPSHLKQPLSLSLTTTSTALTQSKSQKAVPSVTNALFSTGRSRVARQNVTATRKLSQVTTHLHPLIDHDYCEFSAFCADVQSSIISLTESSIRPERRYIKKNRAARTKAIRVSQYVSEVPAVTENRPKRKYCKRKQLGDGEPVKKCGAIGNKLRGAGKLSAASNKAVASTVKDAPLGSDDIDYVKIPGCYQDDYVYYATKRLPGRPRNRAEVSSKTSDAASAKPPVSTASGISVFDWYKEMAQTDKTSRFGVPETSSRSVEEPVTGKDCTPVDESDVADLVMDMLPSGDLARPISDNMTSSSIVESLLSSSYELSGLSNLGCESAVDVANTDLNLMAEEVRLMLSSMGEAELKLLESHLGSEKIVDDMHVDGLDIHSYLGEYATHDNNISLSQSSVTNFLDVDDISDGDLLPVDIANVNIILNDLKASTPHERKDHDGGATVKLETPCIGSIFDKGISNCSDFIGSIGDARLDFPRGTEIAETKNSLANLLKVGENPTLAAPPSTSSLSVAKSITQSDVSPPELTTINMFWNDLPGLLMDGKEFVRLVDIHKQIMPAKDTGILKKRCHMMGLHITNCTELQRDFLIRYMNAAKSKSTVIIAKDDAIMLIGFYVNPKSRSRGSDDFEFDSPPVPPLKSTKASVQQSENARSSEDRLKPDAFLPPNSLPSTGFLLTRSTAGTVTEKNVDSGEPQQLSEDALAGSEGVAEVKRSERLRHKHVSYSDMVHGSLEEGEKSSKPDSSLSVSTSVASVKDAAKGKVESVVESEEVEFEKLVREQSQRRLSVEEKLRLKVLRNCRKGFPTTTTSKPANLGVRRRILKRTKRARRLLAWKRGRKGLKCRPGDLHTLEHCYAALPSHLSGSAKHQSATEHPNVRSSEPVDGPSQDKSQQSLTLPTSKAESKSTSIGVIHRDVTCRVNRRRRSQVGELLVQAYTSNNSPCIRCGNCKEMLSVPQFLKHMHWRRGSEKLVQVTVAQKLQIQSSSRNPDKLILWEEFQNRRARFESLSAAETKSVSVGAVVDAEPNANVANGHHSTRHSSRVAKRKLLHPVEKYVFTKGQPVFEPGPSPKKRFHGAEPDDLSPSATEPVQRPITDAYSNINRKLRQSPLPSRSGKSRRQPIAASDRLLRVSTRRSQLCEQR